MDRVAVPCVGRVVVHAHSVVAHLDHVVARRRAVLHLLPAAILAILDLVALVVPVDHVVPVAVQVVERVIARLIIK